MGLFSKERSEPMYCWICGKEIKVPRLFVNKTMSGRSVCTNCFLDKHLDSLGSEFGKMQDDEIELFLDLMEVCEEHSKSFIPEINFKEFKLSVDPIHQWVKFDGHHNIFDSAEFVAVVYSLLVDMGEAKGELQFYTINPYYRFHRVKVKMSVHGLLKSTQMKALSEKLAELSAALGDVPMLTPKEFARNYKRLLEEKVLEAVQDMGDIEGLLTDDEEEG